jgi:hypothetical protein
MIDWKAHSDQLIKEWELCLNAKPKHDAVNIKLEKDRCEEWAMQLMKVRLWGSELELAEACHQLEPRLKTLKEKIVIEVLQNGSV